MLESQVTANIGNIPHAISLPINVKKMSAATFAARFCAKHHIPPENYVDVALTYSLYPLARLMRPILVLLSSAYFTPDCDFIEDVGRITRLRDFESEVWAFFNHPKNRGFLRNTLKLRVSAQRLRGLVRDILHDSSTLPAQ